MAQQRQKTKIYWQSDPYFPRTEIPMTELEVAVVHDKLFIRQTAIPETIDFPEFDARNLPLIYIGNGYPFVTPIK